MSGENLRSILAYVIIPFAMGAGVGLSFLISIYWLDVGWIRTLIAATGGNVLDLGILPLAGAFGALAIGTNQAITLVMDK